MSHQWIKIEEIPDSQAVFGWRCHNCWKELVQTAEPEKDLIVPQQRTAHGHPIDDFCTPRQ